MGSISDYIEQFILDALNTFNEGRNVDKGIYYILLPGQKTAYYSLWFYHPKAVFHPFVFLSTLDVNAINSINKAMKMLINSFAKLYITNQIDLSSHNSDDIITFGKYRGYHLYEIFTIDPRYISWISDKYEAKVKSEQRFKNLAVTYSLVHQDLNTPRLYKIPVSRFVGSPGDKLANILLTINRVHIEDDPYKTCIIKGTPNFYVDQKIIASDESGNLFFLTVKAADRSLVSGTLSSSSHAYRVGEKLEILSAKILKHFTSRNIRYTKLGYVKFDE